MASPDSRLFRFPLPELADHRREDRYRNREFHRIFDYTKALLLIFGSLFFLFSIADYFVIESLRIFRFTLFLRSSFLVLVVALHLQLDNLNDYCTLVSVLTGYKVLASITFLAIFAVYESPDVIMQSFGVLALILAFSLVPNRWIYRTAVCLALTLGFLGLATWMVGGTDSMQLLAAAIYLNLAVVITTAGSYQKERLARLQFAQNSELMQTWTRDELTGLYNRRKFNQEARQWMKRAKEEGSPLSILILDIDDLKKINDSLGHLAGDKVLKQFARITKQTIRTDDTLARWGGDEFAVLLPHTPKDEAEEMAKRIDRAISTALQDFTPAASCSLGTAEIRQNDDLHTFFHRADMDMYRSKAENGRIKGGDKGH